MQDNLFNRKSIGEHEGLPVYEFDKFKNTIQTGDVFGTAKMNPISIMIRWVTRSRVSHVGLFIWMENDLWIVESLEGKGIRTMPAVNLFAKSRKIFYTKVYSKYSPDKIKERILKAGDFGLPKIGDDYDWFGAIVSPIWDTRTEAPFCSEYDSKILDRKNPVSKKGILPNDIMALGRESCVLTISYNQMINKKRSLWNKIKSIIK